MRANSASGSRRERRLAVDFITDLLDVARIDNGMFALDTRPIDLRDLAAEVATTMSTTAQRIEVRAAEPVMANVDPSRFRQCLENLLANACKHCPGGSVVQLVVRREKRQTGEWASVDVIDEGQGIPPDLLPHIFDRFVTGQGRKSGGLGLGLFLAKRIAVMHDGDLTVESQPGQGARFSLTLPASD